MNKPHLLLCCKLAFFFFTYFCNKRYHKNKTIAILFSCELVMWISHLLSQVLQSSNILIQLQGFLSRRLVWLLRMCQEIKALVSPSLNILLQSIKKKKKHNHTAAHSKNCHQFHQKLLSVFTSQLKHFVGIILVVLSHTVCYIDHNIINQTFSVMKFINLRLDQCGMLSPQKEIAL